VISIALLVGGIVNVDCRCNFYASARDAHGRNEFVPSDLDWRLPNSFGGFSGTSRSMSTIAAGQIVGLSRPAALEFSFFLSMPTMVVATGYDLLKTLKLHSGYRR